ncbi:MAG: ABC transporter permease [Anaerolineales bacterium]|nr:ABC transporter permease [Anaerolineales bacterium]
MAVAQPTAKAPSRSLLTRARNAVTIIAASPVAIVGLAIVLFWFGLGITSLFWTPHDPLASEFVQNLPPAWTAEGSSENLLGTDHLGRDMLSRLMTGTQVILLKTRIPLPNDDVTSDEEPSRIGLFLKSIFPNRSELVIPGGVALWGVFGSLAVGSTLGLLAGYKGGWTDQITMQVLDALIAFPRIVLYIVVIGALGQSDLIMVLAITITGAPGIARLARSLALDIKTRDYIRAAETRGEGLFYIMFREILPNARGPLLVDAMLRVGYAIFTIGTLGFLGLGLQPPEPDWGTMVNDARRFIFSTAWPVIWPAIAISTVVIGLNLFADGVREELTRYQK